VEVHHLILKEENSMNIDKKMHLAAERKRDLCQRFLALAQGSDSADPDADDMGSVASEATLVLEDEENPQ